MKTTLLVNFDIEQKKELEELADASGLSMAEIIRTAVSKYLAKLKGE